MRCYFSTSPNSNEIAIERVVSQDENGMYLKCTNKKFVIRLIKDIDENMEKKINKFIGTGIKINGVCFPSKKVYDETGTLVGFSIPKPAGGRSFKDLMKPDNLNAWKPNWSRLELTKLAISLMKIIKELRENDILLGDINPRNIIIKNENEVFLIGTEFFQIGSLPYTPQNTEFHVPELMAFGEMRARPQEDFAIASLIFEIFLPGRHPYASDYDSIKNNIENNLFNYALGDNERISESNEKWNAVWYSLPQEMRQFFFNSFNDNQAPSPAVWADTILPSFLNQLESNECSKDIFPSNTKLVLSNKSRNMNLRDVTESNETLRVMETKLSEKEEPEKIGVLELSTKAVKLLIGKDPKEIRETPFNFKMFFRDAQKTNTGRGLDAQNNMDLSYFKQNVLPAIRRYKAEAIRQDVDILYTVATAAYRTAKNREEIIELIRKDTGINVRILTKSEEATATIKAFKHTTSQKDFLKEFEYTMIIDQGGGSTEVSIFRNWKEIKSYSINLGTEVLRSLLFQESTNDTELRYALSNTDRLIKERLRSFYRNMLEFLPKDEPIFCIAVGTAITNSTGKKGNSKQHDTRMSIISIQEKISKLDQRLKNDYIYVRNLYNDLNGFGSYADKLDRDIIMRIGLPMFINILSDLKMDAVYVSGTGLWYGIYFQQLFNDFEDTSTDEVLKKSHKYDYLPLELADIFEKEDIASEKTDLEFEDKYDSIMESKTKSKIEQVARIIIANYGEGIIAQTRFVNMLEDLLAFIEHYKRKAIFMQFIKLGFANEILNLQVKNSKTIESIALRFSQETNTSKSESLRIGKIITYGLNL